jgi:type VI secretion system protein VasD
MNTDAVTQARFPRRRVREALIGLFLVLAALLLAHPDANAAKTVKVKVALTAAEDLNPDYQGRPSPVNLIVFQLTSADAFSTLDFFSLFDPEAAALGGDMLSRTQMLLQPGEVREWEADFEKETRYVGVIAAYRDIENAQWRAVVELPEKGLIGRFFKKNKLYIAVDSLAVTVATKK